MLKEFPTVRRAEQTPRNTRNKHVHIVEERARRVLSDWSWRAWQASKEDITKVRQGRACLAGYFAQHTVRSNGRVATGAAPAVAAAARTDAQRVDPQGHGTAARAAMKRRTPTETCVGTRVLELPASRRRAESSDISHSPPHTAHSQQRRVPPHRRLSDLLFSLPCTFSFSLALSFLAGEAATPLPPAAAAAAATGAAAAAGASSEPEGFFASPVAATAASSETVPASTLRGLACACA